MVPDSRWLSAIGRSFAVVVFTWSAAARAQERPTTLSVEGRSSDNVSIAASGNFVVVAWSAATTGVTDIYAAASRDGGVSFSPPARVNGVAGQARVDGEMPPRIALIPRANAEPEIRVIWTTAAGKTWRLLMARSTDGARSFGATSAVPGTDGPGTRGWESVAVDPRGRVVVAWVDHREWEPGSATAKSAKQPASHATHEMSDSEEKAGLSTLLVTTLGANAPREIARSVCYCCKTSLVAVGNDVHVVWRHVFPGNERDIAIATSRDGGQRFSAPARVSNDRWKFDGCPDNGPTVAIDRQRRAHVFWVTPQEGGDVSQMVMYHAVSPDGRAFSPRQRITTKGLPGHAQVVTEPNGNLLLAWDEIGQGTRRVLVARVAVDPNGATRLIPVPSPEEGEGHHPTIATTPGGTLMAWVRHPSKGAPSTIGVARVR